ncbi:PREDICTED: coiled-coil domain-containing protein 157 isoform X2 [Gavialis gangeticus]|uniref:coiled-coil domain-containing protein 157 isoform X2 n=1 Tax=Gavialis gangeticus TaxID=94835 RepID=UPI00092FC671|nr:PREDICTED: coiled-coil domain-containing protein 157 isoform X2 [Gavialis gangeticus]
MAQPAGGRTCVESLRRDVTDLQGAIADVCGRAGPARFRSWKFPDRLSCELDVVALLQRYDYVEGDAELTRRSHVALLELVIDRLLLLLQSFTGYAENLVNEQAVPPPQAVGPCMSVGLTVRKYWNSMLKLGALYQQSVSENKSNRKEASALKSTLQNLKAENEHLRSCSPVISELGTFFDCTQATTSCLSQNFSVPDYDINDLSRPRSAYSVTRNNHSVHSQTIESSLVPCDSCASAQASLQEVSKAIVSICRNQNIPSSLCKFQKMIEETMFNKTLAATDMRYWASEQMKDLSRINKHLGMLMQLINPLKTELEESEKQKDELRKQVEDFAKVLQQEKDIQEQQRQAVKQCLEKKNKENHEIMAKLEKDNENAKIGTALLEEQISSLKEELASQQATVKELELIKMSLLEEMRTKMVDKSQMLKLQEQVQLVTTQLESTSQELSKVTLQLDKEKAKVKSMLRHEESLQAKQRVLLQQLDSVDQECEELRTTLSEAEEDKAKLVEQLKEMQDKKQQVQHKLEAQQELTENLEQEKQSLEQSTFELHKNVSELEELIQELKERQRLLVSFPDLHIPVEAQFESTGNVAEDMEKQLQANNIRIYILEQENFRLRTALVKMREAAKQGALRLIPQTQLWIHSSPQTSSKDGVTDHNKDYTGNPAGAHRPPSSQAGNDSLVSRRPPSSQTSKARQRPPSSQQTKPSSLETTCKELSCLSLLPDNFLLNNNVKPKGQDSVAGVQALPSRSTRNHQK